MVGGTIVDIVQVSATKWWCDTADRSIYWGPNGPGRTVAIYLNPMGEKLEVGDSLWWQGQNAFWTPRIHADGRRDVRLPKIGSSGVSHPDKLQEQVG